ncbi:AAEL007729-PA [Aedes aegypti]|uniref:AAEL007729-PA n=1 Tax=Aedes aegypti TaxID=7159 RepID=Q170Z4_AEDAE|nr:AAEL007729-PA [Aedes aegypti]
MPRIRSNASQAATVKRSESAAAGCAGEGGGAAPTPLGKRSSSVLQSVNKNNSSEDDIDKEQQQLVKKFRSELHINKKVRSSRRLKNITNIVDQQTAVEVAGKKRKIAVEQQQNGKESDEPTKRAKSNDVDEIAEVQNKLRDVLGRHYFDVANRVGLEHVPGCLRNVGRCAKLHAKRTNQARKVNQRIQQDTREMLIENRPLNFLGYIEQALLRNEFIDGPLFVKALEMILTINEPSDQLNANYSVGSVLQQTVDILDQTVDHFPPCWLDLKRAYQSVIFGVLEEECFEKYDRSEGLFKVVLFLLEKFVESKAGDCGASLSRTLSNQERSMANFHLWEQAYIQKYDFDMLSREDKLDRLFLVLQILVKILEYDLTMWILRHPHNVKENMINPNRMPLIAALLWNENSTVGETNSLIKRIIALYVNATAVHYPKDAVETFSRLVSIIGTAINLTEIQYDGSVEYPCIKQNTRYFAQQIMRHLETSGYHSVSLCLRTIEQMRSPLLRMLLAGDLLQKLTPLPMDTPCAASYLKHLIKGKWKAFRIDNPPERDAQTDRDRFSFLDQRKQRKSAHEIGRPQYVNLLLTAFKSYMQVFPLKTYFQGGCGTPRESDSHGSTPSPTNQSVANHVNLPALEKDLPRQMKQLKTSGTKFIRRKNGGDSQPLILEEINVTPSLLLHYRDEVKHLLLMQRWLQTKAGTSPEERELFAPWRSYLATIDESLVCE